MKTHIKTHLARLVVLSLALTMAIALVAHAATFDTPDGPSWGDITLIVGSDLDGGGMVNNNDYLTDGTIMEKTASTKVSNIKTSEVMPMNTPQSTRFGTLLHDFRVREGLTQRKVAAVLQVDESTIARLEAGTRKPPRDPEFYERLWQLPGFTDSDIARLLRTGDAPRWVAAIDLRGTPSPLTSQPQQVDVGGIKVVFTVQVDASDLSQENVEYLGEVIKRDIELCIRDYINHEAKRDKLISTG